ncbi:MAG: primosomal protein N' (replication factor Y) - superfamily II helicase, partial [Planctomycetota bacterium]|nr:primosomal protein N' (replication factor Y) - superfamily II helicase [Planctomycetota bacterium]
MKKRQFPCQKCGAGLEFDPGATSHLVPYADDYLSGFRAQSHQVDLAEGFELARSIMDGTIRRTVRRDIGGDAQRIDSLRTRHDDVTFKHV